MIDAMFDLPSSGVKDEIVVTKKYATEKLDKQDIKRLKVA
jgi:hypothetical protein